MYTAAKSRYEVLSQLCESDTRFADTLRRRNDSGLLNRELAHRHEVLRVELESRLGFPEVDLK